MTLRGLAILTLVIVAYIMLMYPWTARHRKAGMVEHQRASAELCC